MRRDAWSARRRRGRPHPCRRWRGGPAARSAPPAHWSRAAPASLRDPDRPATRAARDDVRSSSSPAGARSTRRHPRRRRPAAGAEDTAAGVGRGAAEVQPVDRAAVAGQLGQRPPREHRVQPHLHVHDVAAQQPQLALEVERRLHVHRARPCPRSRARPGRRPATSFSPSRSRMSSQLGPSASSYGCHCPQTVTLCLPGRRDASGRGRRTPCPSAAGCSGGDRRR